MKYIDSESVANALIDTFSRVGFPGELLSDQGTNFMSSLMEQMCKLLQIRKMNTTPYHPQANGLVENFNGTLKKMLKCYAKDEPEELDRHIPFVLFAYRDSPHESTGYSPFELLYGRKVRGPLQLIKESWEEPDKEEGQESLVSFIMETRDRLKKMNEVALEIEARQKKKQKGYFDKKSKVRELELDQKVLVLLPSNSNKLLAEWKGPYRVIEKVSPVDYKIQINRRTEKIFHINMLKVFHERAKDESERHEAIQCLDIVCSIEDSYNEDDGVETTCMPTGNQKETVKDVNISSDLLTEQNLEVGEMIHSFSDVFTDIPGRTEVITHDVKLKEEKAVYRKPYCLPFALRSKVKEELHSMIKSDIIEESNSPWAAPIVCVPKKDKSLRLCVDYRGLNSQTIFDPQPMPKIEEVINKLGKAKYISKLDLTKGYWQIPLTEKAKEVSAFVTPFGHFQFKVLPFGMINSAASFVRLIKRVLKGTEEFADSFIDDIIIFSDTWNLHLTHVKCVLNMLRSAHLTAKPSKCFIGFRQIEFLAHVVGNGEVRPTEEKVKAVQQFPIPTTKRKVRSLIGFLNFHRRFIPGFAQKAAPITDLTSKSAPNKVVWKQEHQKAFEELKLAITSFPVLIKGTLILKNCFTFRLIVVTGE